LIVLIIVGGCLAGEVDQIARGLGAGERLAVTCAGITIVVLACGITTWIFNYVVQ
jgi:hypothetical protein